MVSVRITAKFKDTLFRMIFGGKKELLDLYNAINHSNYQNPDDLIVTTIGDVLYMGMKNDISFLIGQYLNLYEAQSSWNPNMPLRGFFYLSRLYQAFVAEHEMDLFSKQLLKLPAPQFIVFYNGTKTQPDQMELRLSDAFLPSEKTPCLECVATVYNINYGHNSDLMEKCHKLYEYAYLINAIRSHLRQNLPLENAVDQAVKECIGNNILKGFLLKHREEVREMILSEYNEELHIKSEKKISFEEGAAQGQERVNLLIARLAEAGRTEDLIRSATDPEYQEQLFREFGLFPQCDW